MKRTCSAVTAIILATCLYSIGQEAAPAPVPAANPAPVASPAPNPNMEQFKELRTQYSQLQMKLYTIQRKFTEDAELVALRKAMTDAQKALESKVREKTMADPEGANLLKELDTLTAKMQELMPKRPMGHQERGIAPQPPKKE
jgi:hypothetical protein